ncbi:MAG: transposase family protein [Staphylothermus sp.]|nr:transposase family protein [Staphylothermus sp.]
MLEVVPKITPALLRKISREYNLPEAIVADIYAKLRHYARIRDIAQVYKIPYRKALSIAHDLGFTRKTIITENIERKVIELRKQGLMYKDIAKYIGISETSVWRILKKHGLVNSYRSYVEKQENNNDNNEIITKVPEDGIKNQEHRESKNKEVIHKHGSLLIEIDAKGCKIRIILMNEVIQ